MHEFFIGRRQFRTELLNARQQHRIARRIDQMLPEVSADRSQFDHGATALSRLFGALNPLTNLDERDAEFLMETCVEACEVLDDGWVPATGRVDLPETMTIIIEVSTFNLAPLFALQRPVFQRSFGGVTFEPATMPDGEDWLWRPVARRLCGGESIYNGKLHIEDFARMNDVLDVAEENERRAYKAAERKV